MHRIAHAMRLHCTAELLRRASEGFGCGGCGVAVWAWGGEE